MGCNDGSEVMHWPQITYIILLSSGLTQSLIMHGKPKGDYNFFYNFLAAGIIVALLYFGGFFG